MSLYLTQLESKYPELQKVRPFGIIEQFSKKIYTRFTLYPVCVKSSMGCVIVEGETLAHFTAQM